MPVNTLSKTNQFETDPSADQRLQQMLALYKPLATIRETKEVFFYCETSAPTVAAPWLFYNFGLDFVTDSITRLAVPPFLGKIGTQVKFNIADKIGDIMNTRVPSDKIMYDINLVEVSIESDTDGWVAQPDLAVVWVNDTVSQLQTFTTEPGDAQIIPNPPPGTGDTSDPPRYAVNNQVVTAKKLFKPQTLYCRIKELSNNQPYNWSVTNSGDYSIDKGHQLLVRHSDIVNAELTLEYGHLGFRSSNAPRPPSSSNDGATTLDNNYLCQDLPNDRKEYQSAIYLDYNSEVFNTQTLVVQSTTVNGFNNNENHYPTWYAGVITTPTNVAADAKDIAKFPQENVNQTDDRPPYYQQDYLASLPNPQGRPSIGSQTYMLYQGKPLFYNQQVSKMNFRFVVRVINLF